MCELSRGVELTPFYRQGILERDIDGGHSRMSEFRYKTLAFLVLDKASFLGYS